MEPEIEVFESQAEDVRLICLLFTTTSPLEEAVKASVTSSDGTAMSFSTELGKKRLLCKTCTCVIGLNPTSSVGMLLHMFERFCVAV